MSATREFLFVADDLGVGWLHVPSGRRLPVVSGGDGPNGDTATEDPPAQFQIPEDLSELTDEDLDPENPEGTLAKAQAALDLMVEAARAEDAPAPTPSEVQIVRDLAGAISDIKAEGKARRDAEDERRREFEEAVASITDSEQGDPDGGEEGGENGGEGGEQPEAPEVPGQPSETPVEGELVNAQNNSRAAMTVVVPTRSSAPKLNPTLAEIARRQENPGVVTRGEALKITAASDVPGFSNGEQIDDLDALAKAASDRCRALGNGPHFVPLAKIARNFPMVLDPDTMTPQQVREAWAGMLADQMGGSDLTNAKSMEALVAAGGWCAPSEIRYDFFQISEVSGLVDLPTFGVRRGGLRWPQSLSLFDFFAISGAPASGLPTNATMPWEWTETDDIAAATGSPQKACLRPPCPGFDEARLRVFGLCVLAGNLTEDAFPELIRHFLAQTVVAHARVINRRFLLQMVAASTATTPDSQAGSAVTAWLGGLELNAMDYREKHGMADTAVLEVVAPSWARGVLRSDLAKKNGLSAFDVADAFLMEMFDVRRLRVQWVQDWQTRLASGIAPVSGTPPTTWPTTAQTIMYAPGTFGRGNGMTLDLGVVRDSTLNKANDHTAAWSEEATLLAKFGHESRVITLDTVAAGGSGATTLDLTGP